MTTGGGGCASASSSSSTGASAHQRITFAEHFGKKLESTVASSGESSEDVAEVLLDAMNYIRRYHSTDVTAPVPAPAPTLGAPSARPGVGVGVTGGIVTTPTSFDGTTTTDNRGKIYSDYLSKVDGVGGCTTTSSAEAFGCPSCASDLINDRSQGQLVCVSCGQAQDYTDFSSNAVQPTGDSTGVSYSSSYSYRRSNHFSDWLTAFQGKQNVTVPDDVIDAVRIEIRKHRITDSNCITPDLVLKFLKKLRLSQQYENRFLICNMLNGHPIPKIDRHLESKLACMFSEVEMAFDKFKAQCPNERKNFLSYSFTLNKFCQLLDRDDLMVFFPLLKSRQRLANQDRIWLWICRELRWEFIPSV